jgi:hypothetical protein
LLAMMMKMWKAIRPARVPRQAAGEGTHARHHAERRAF